MVGGNQPPGAIPMDYESFDRLRAQELGGTFVVQTASGFSDEQIEELKQLVDEEHAPGVLSAGAGVDPVKALEHQKRLASVRRSEIRWLDEARFRWVYERAWELVRAVNARYRFRIQPIRERIQLSIYDGEDNGFYTWHTDTTINNMSRKISMSIPLSSPYEYTGGEFQFMVGGEGVSVPQPRGGAIIFPSFLLHRVMPVTSGRRFSLVIWVSGPHWS
jgi:PKHD-type hydroxylase